MSICYDRGRNSHLHHKIRDAVRHVLEWARSQYKLLVPQDASGCVVEMLQLEVSLLAAHCPWTVPSLQWRSLKLLDTLCSCHGVPRPIGGCTHAIAVLRLLNQLTNRVEPVQPTRSELMLKRALWHFQGSDSEGSTGSGSGSDSDTESSSSGSGVIDFAVSPLSWCACVQQCRVCFIWCFPSCEKASVKCRVSHVRDEVKRQWFLDFE